MPKVIFRNSDFRHYRIPFYDALCEKHDVKFIFRFNDVPDKYNYISVSKEKSSFWRDKKFLKQYLKILLGNFDVFIASLPTHSISVLGIIFSRLRGKKVIIWVERWLIPDKKGLKGYLKYIYHKLLYQSADAYFVTGSKAKSFVKKFVKADDKKIFKTLQANTDMKNFEAITPDLNLPEDHIIFLYFGRIIDWKGLNILINAFNIVNNKYGKSTLLVVGDGDFKQYCENLVEELRVKNVRFLPPVRDNDNRTKAGIYKLCDVFILPSTIVNNQTEGWGLTVGEAMSMSKPVIVTDAVGCSNDLVIDGVNGYFVKHGSVEQLAQALLKSIKNKSSLSKMGRNSRNIFEEKISFEKMAIKLSDAIDYVYN